MRKSNILCKSLSTVESLGAVSIICSDKTGTLTQNKMTVANIAIGPNRYTVAEGREEAATSSREGQTVKLLASIAGLCNDAAFEPSVSDVPVEVRKVNGDATGR
jgi:sodium/potassium-transporting ATPase subunit alpha